MKNNITEIKIIKGNIIFTKNSNKFDIVKNGYIIVESGKIKEILTELTKNYLGITIEDWGDKLIIPGMCDLHCHASQYRNTGIGMDKELLPWLNSYTFPEEAKFKDLSYAEKIFKNVIKDIWRNGTTRVCLFPTIHKDATKLLIDLLISSGLSAFVGKVNMDRNSPDYLSETAEQSLKDTEDVISYALNKSTSVKPIITPRFVPTCSDELMKGLGNLAKKYNLPIQSHISENVDEINWVKELHPENKFYGDVYNFYNLFGQTPTLMAHSIYSEQEEIDLIKKNNVMIVHCPISNVNIGSGIMPCRKYLDEGISVSLGTDVSGGSSYSIIKTMVYTIQLSKLYWVQSNKTYPFLSTSEAFYLATKSGGSFFGKVGSFEEGYEFDALIIDDSKLNEVSNYSISERLERFIYLGDDRNIICRYINGEVVSEPSF